MIIYAVVLASLAWVFWQFIRPFVEKSPLDVVPGPTRKSLISGTFLLCRLSSHHGSHPSSGNLQQLFDRDAWDFHDEVAQDYGSVVKIHAVLGVSTASL